MLCMANASSPVIQRTAVHGGTLVLGPHEETMATMLAERDPDELRFALGHDIPADLLAAAVRLGEECQVVPERAVGPVLVQIIVGAFRR